MFLSRRAARPSFVLLIAAAMVVFATPAAASRAPAADAAWSPPVHGGVAEPFEAPESPHAAGHRGVDYAAEPGTPVRAAGDGVVSFSGVVAGTQHVVIAHGGGLRTSYSFLASRTVRAGKRVTRETVIGRSGGNGPHHAADVLHFGLRRGDDYLDPLLLFRPADLVKSVHLVPSERSLPAPAPDLERAGLAASLDLGRDGGLPAFAGGDLDIYKRKKGSPFWRRAGGWMLDRGRDTAEWVADKERRTVGTGPANLLLDGAHAVDEWADGDCVMGHAADRSRTSGHAVMFVAGINSGTDTDTGATNGIHLGSLGYARSEVSFFSYAPDGGPYEPADTLGSIDSAARRLRDQLRANYARDSRQVDLIAHSMGGVVVRRFLERYADPYDDTLPPIRQVVTFSSPLDGAPLGDLFESLDRSAAGQIVNARAGFPTGSVAPAQLAEHSGLVEELRRERIAQKTEFLSVSAPLDLVVPGTRTQASGATHEPVDVWSPNAHSDITNDADALGAAATFLSTGHPSCQSLGTHLRNAVIGNVTSGVERGVANGIGLLDR